MKPLFFMGRSLLPGQALAFATEQLETDVLSDHERAFWSLIQQWFNPACRAFSLQTSGSTGSPKSISFSRNWVEEAANAQILALNSYPIDHAWLALPVDRAGGFMLVIRALLAGWNISLLTNRLDPLLELSEEAKQERNVVLSLLPAQAVACLNSGSINEAGNCFSLILLGGANVSESLGQQLNAVLPCAMLQTYGMTESLSFVALKTLEDSHFTLISPYKAKEEADTSLTISLPAYWTGLTENEHFYLPTNDSVELDVSNQDRFKVLGRLDNLINSGGLKLLPEQLENDLSNLIQDTQITFAIVGVPHEKWGERPVWVFQEPLPDEALWKGWLSQTISRNRPVAIASIPAFPLSEAGKLKRSILKASILEHQKLIWL